MTEATGFAYAGARMQARYRDRLTASTWSNFGRIGDFAHLVQTVRATPLGPWVSDFTGDTGGHRIESGLREQFRREVGEVAQWVPAAWREAMAWFAWLPDLSTLAHVRHARPPQAWMSEDPVARRVAVPAKADASALPPDLLAAVRDPDDGRVLTERWLEAWRARWPRHPPSDDGPLARAQREVGRLIGTKAGHSRDEGAVEPELRRLFRRHGRSAAGAFAYLGLLYIQFTRLRGTLLRRRLFQAAA